MTNYNNTDKIIREKFESMDPVFDAESMWDELAPMVERKKRRGFFFWTLSGIMIGILSLVSFNYLKSESIDFPINKLAIEENYNESTIVFSQNIDASVNDNLSNNNSVVNNQFTHSDNQEGNVDLIENMEEVDVTVNRFFDDVNYSNSLVNNKFNSDEHISNSIRINDNISENYFVQEDVLNTGIQALVNTRMVLLDRLPVVNLSSLKSNGNVEIVDGPKMPNDYYTRPLLKKEWRIAVNGGYYIHSRSFESNGTDVSDNYAYRSTEEEAKDGYDLGVKLEYFLSEHFVLFGGVRFSQSFVQRTAEYTYTETISLDDHVVAIINTEDGPIEIREDITYDGIFMHNADNYITATRLGLITGLQYRLRADRWTTHLDFGFEIPVWNSHSGVITNSRRPYNLSDDTELINTSSLQILGGIGVEYSLTPKTALQATLGGFMPLNNEHVESYGIEKKSSLLGLNFGVHFRL